MQLHLARRSPIKSPTSSETPDSSDFLATEKCSSKTVLSSSAKAAKSNNFLSMFKPNHPNVSVTPVQKLSTQTVYLRMDA